MKFEKIYIKNYRQFEEIKLDFTNKYENDLNIIIGKNMAGKSNFFNALNWCIYNTEIQLKDESKTKPILNVNEISKAKHNENKIVSVKIEIRQDDGSKIIIDREVEFKVYKNKKGLKPGKENHRFEVTVLGIGSENTKIFEGEKAEEMIERIVPSGIKEYFFFDGERLQNYFKSQTGKKIKSAIFQISQVHLLDRIRGRFEDLETDFRREVTNKDPDAKKLNLVYESKKETLKKIEKSIQDCTNQIKESENIIKDVGEELRNIPKIKEIEEKNQKLKREIETKNRRLDKKEKELKEFLFQKSIDINLFDAIRYTQELINKKKSNNELPPDININHVKESLEKNECYYCESELSEKSYQRMHDLYEIKSQEDVFSSELLEINSNTQLILSNLIDFESQRKRINKEIKEVQNDLDYFLEELNKIKKQLSSYSEEDKEDIKRKRVKRNKNEQLKNDNLEKRGKLKEQKIGVETEIKNLERKLEKELKKVKKVELLNHKREISNELLNACDKIINNVMLNISKKIKDEAEEKFISLVWKKEAYNRLEIDENYEISLYDNYEYDSIGSCSAAEKSLLALGFTLALHKVSGFEFPLTIDTPISRVSDINRELFAKSLVEVSKKKQIILLFTPSEYSDEISNLMEGNYNKKYYLEPENDTITRVKEVVN